MPKDEECPGVSSSVAMTRRSSACYRVFSQVSLSVVALAAVAFAPAMDGCFILVASSRNRSSLFGTC